VDGLGAARRDEDLVRVEGDAVLGEIAGDGLAQLEEPLGRAIAQDRLAPGVSTTGFGAGMSGSPILRWKTLTPLALAASA